MRTRLFSTVFALFMASSLSAQVDIAVISTRGNTHQLSLESSGEIYITSTDMIVMTSSATGNTVSFAIDTIGKVLFSSDLGIGSIHEASSITIYPSPTSDAFILSGIGSGIQNLTLYNASGLKVYKTVCQEGKSVSIGHLPEGVYLVKVGTSFGKIVKQ